MSVLAVLEHRAGVWNRMSWETVAAAQELGQTLGVPALAAVIGGPPELPAQAAAHDLGGVLWLRHGEGLLDSYSADGYTEALERVIRSRQPGYVLFPHTYQVRDFAPKLAARLGRGMVSDCIRFRVDEGRLLLVRQLFQGKLNAELEFLAPPPGLISHQAGAWRADAARPGSAPVEEVTLDFPASAVRTTAEAPFREAQRSIDLTAAPLIVAVGRGLQDQANLKLIEELAASLGAEIAASRPICDAGWLPMERQVGSSGQTVSPKLYVAVGISGAIQHLVGMKGAKTVVAINKDPDAPIFEIADYGIAGDLFEVVPAIIEALRKP